MFGLCQLVAVVLVNDVGQRVILVNVELGKHFLFEIDEHDEQAGVVLLGGDVFAKFPSLFVPDGTCLNLHGYTLAAVLRAGNHIKLSPTSFFFAMIIFLFVQLITPIIWYCG